MKKISSLQYITTSAQLAEQACLGGVNWIQLRLKETPIDALKSIALEVQTVCKQFGATFIVNDHVHLAASIGADGVHLGKEDMLPTIARNILGNASIIGCTTNTLADVVQITATNMADYVGCGPYKFTTTKQKLSPIVGLAGYQQIVTGLQTLGKNPLPIIAIGGIALNDVASLKNIGIYGVAISGAISNAANVTEAAKAFAAACK